MKETSKRAERWSGDVEKTKKGVRVAGLRPDRGHIGHKAAKMMKRSKNLEHRAQQALEEKSGLLKNLETTDNLKLDPLAHYKEVLVQLEHAGISYDGRSVQQDFYMEVRRGERIASQGRKGCGKSSVLNMILQTHDPEKCVFRGNENVTGNIRFEPALLLVEHDAEFIKKVATRVIQL